MIFPQDKDNECEQDIWTYINDYELENSDRIKLVKMKGKQKEGIYIRRMSESMAKGMV